MLKKVKILIEMRVSDLFIGDMAIAVQRSVASNSSSVSLGFIP
jgi:hypothetical protein